ncbi:MAG: aspartate-semialdehyde dehydrogenase [Legionellales bacterium]|nr:aspartate-semialdehyde dehydrogenase [Legionellales bacterium]
MTRAMNVAVVGATGAVGEAMLAILAQRNFPVQQVVALASERSVGKTVMFGEKSLAVQDLAGFDFSDTDIALFSAGGAISKQYAPKASAQGCVVIDNTSHFRLDAQVPLVIPEVNPETIADYRHKGIIANPNCSTIQMLVALKPLHDAAHIERINVATYQAVSGSGQAAVEELAGQTAQLLNGHAVETQAYPVQIAFNVLPYIDQMLENDYTREEMKMVWETQKILNDETIKVNPTAARVPVFYGHSEAIHIETREKITVAQARALLGGAPGVQVVDDAKGKAYLSAFTHASGEDPVFVGRIREDISHPHGLNLWVVADNVRKGAALNAVQIAEILSRDYLNCES